MPTSPVAAGVKDQPPPNDKVSAVSRATPAAPTQKATRVSSPRTSTVAGSRRATHSSSSDHRTAPSDAGVFELTTSCSSSANSVLSSIKSLRRKKYVRQRLSPLDSEQNQLQPADALSAAAVAAMLTEPSVHADNSSSRRDDYDAVDSDAAATIERLARVHATLHSDDAMRRWILTYESECARFASFAVFTEMKLDEVAGSTMGRPNAVEAAACFASLLKMPGIVGCYASLLEKLADGLESAIYVVDDVNGDDSKAAAAIASRRQQNDAAATPMAALVRANFERPTYFARVRDLRTQLRASRSLYDTHVLQTLSVDELVRVFVLAPQQQLERALAALTSAQASTARFDALLLFMTEHQAEYLRAQQQGDALLPRAINANEDAAYPFNVPLATSAQICRAIAHSASAFSSSGIEMLLCAILEHVDVESFRDVFLRFDTHGKALFLHYVSLVESSEGLDAIAAELPSAGDTLFRLYATVCGAQCDPASTVKPVFFDQLLGDDMAYCFLCDLATFLDDDHFALLTHEFDKHAHARKRRRRALQRSGVTAAENDNDNDDNENTHNDRDDDSSNSSIELSIESFQLVIWNFVRDHKLTSAQVLSIVTTVLLPSLDTNELAALLDVTLAQLSLDARWTQLLRIVDEIDTEHSASASAAAVPAARRLSSSDSTSVEAMRDNVRATRLTLLKKLFAMLTRDERERWLDKTNATYTTEAMRKRLQSLKLEAATKTVVIAAPEPSPSVSPVATLASASNSLADPTTLVPSMPTELKLAWIECLLQALATDKENSARMAMLRQVLLPFFDSRVPGVNSSGLPPKISLASVEKSIMQMLNQLTAVERLKVLAKLAPAPMVDIDDTPTLDRATSPIPALHDDDVRLLPGALAPALPTTNTDILRAFETLLACKSESRVVQILRNGLIIDDDRDSSAKAAATPAATAVIAPTDKPHTAPDSKELKRQPSAVVAVTESIESQAPIALENGVDAACQTEFEPLAPIESATSAPCDKAPSRTSVVPIKFAPLTLTALLAKPIGGGGATTMTSPRKRDGSKYQKINSTAVPRAIGGLVTSWRMNAEQLAQFAKKPLSAVLKTIADAYGELLTAGRRARFGPVRARELTLAQVVYQQFLHSYGLPGIADTHLLAFACAVETYRPQHLRVEYFARFCFDEVPRAELANYLEFLECIVCDDVNLVSAGAGAGGATASTAMSTATGGRATPLPLPPKRGRFVPRIVVPDREAWSISVDKAQEAAHLCFRAMRKPSVLAFCDRLVAIAAIGTSAAVPASAAVGTGTGTGALSSAESSNSNSSNSNSSTASDLTINVDHLLQLVAHEWHDEQRRRDAFLLDAFRAGDVNGDGQLTSAEFSRIVLSIDRTRDAGDILLMFSETLRRAPGREQIDTDVFLQVAKEYELDRAVWSSDGDVRNSVGDVRDLEATWRQHSRWFFLGTLDALARDLAPHHFLRVCEGAGCGCLKCILDSYIGFQRMRRDFALAQTQFSSSSGSGGSPNTIDSPKALGPVSESLVWARYWHLMRQLYEAASESDGIATPWDGCAARLRVTPAPALAPRFVAHRRFALPNLLFPDTQRVSARPRAVHDPEAFDAATINAQFADLLAHMTIKKHDGAV